MQSGRPGRLRMTGDELLQSGPRISLAQQSEQFAGFPLGWTLLAHPLNPMGQEFFLLNLAIRRSHFLGLLTGEGKVQHRHPRQNDAWSPIAHKAFRVHRELDKQFEVAATGSDSPPWVE